MEQLEIQNNILLRVGFCLDNSTSSELKLCSQNLHNKEINMEATEKFASSEVQNSRLPPGDTGFKS